MFNFKNPQIQRQSLIHRSYLNENKDEKLTSNERMEFLGDAILEFWISDYLYKKFPNFSEGDLTNLRSLSVCTNNLAKTALNIKLGEKILLSKGEEKHGGRTNTSILADDYDSLIGAIYLDSGIKAVSQFLEKTLVPSIRQLSKQKTLKDPKSIFQEIAQNKEGITPNYKTISESGPDHKKEFEVGVYLGNRLVAKGRGNSKQRAEEDASLNATKIFQNQV